jgi:putative membrane protein
MFRTRYLQWIWLVLFFAGLAASGIHPKDRFTWVLEVFPAWIVLALLIATRKSFPLTPLLYALILLHCCILFAGGRYTYAEVPLGDWVRDVFHQARNNYDKLGHFAQGFTPALAAREILMRKRIVNGSGWLFFLTCSICLGFSALYELLEWAVAMTTGSGAEAFLGTQGDPWDTQSDMLMALVGSLTAQIFLGKWQNRQISRIPSGIA